MTKKSNLDIAALLTRNPQVDREQLAKAIALLRELSDNAAVGGACDPTQYSRTTPKQPRRRPVRLRTRL